MGKYTKRYGKWTGYTVADCACEFCLYWKKKKPCPLEVCCCAEEREKARRREQEADWVGTHRRVQNTGGFSDMRREQGASKINAPRKEECHAGICEQRAS